MPHIFINDFSLFYNKTKALHNISLTIPDCRITALLGPSGCGKTTLLKSINRLHDLNEDTKVQGRILLDNINIYDPDADLLALRKKVGFISQKPFPLPMSIYENVVFGIKLHKTNLQTERPEIITTAIKGNYISADARPDPTIFKNNKINNIAVEYYLRQAGLWEELKFRLYEPASKLSIGQQQRLSLARALTIEPEVILADEPTSALDPISTEKIEARFALLKSRYTIVLVTHILRQAKRLADHIAFMYYGRLIESSDADKFFSCPQQEKTKEYINGVIN